MHAVSRSLRYFSHERVPLVLLFAAVGVGTLAALMQIWPMIVFLDAIVTDRPQTSWIHRLFLAPLPSSYTGQIVGLAVITLLLRLVQECASRMRGLVSLRIAYSGLVRVRCDLFRKLQAQSLSYHHSQPQGDAIYRLITDTFGCQTILNVVIDLVVAGLMLCIMIYILVSRNAILTLAALSVSPFLLAANIYFGRVLSSRTKRAKEADCELTTRVQRSMATMRLVQAFGKEREEFHGFHRSAHDSIRAWLRLHWQEVCYGLTVSIIFGIGGALVFGYGGYLVWVNQHTPGAGMTVGDLMLFMTYLGMLYDPLCKISGSGGSFQAGIASAQRVFEVLDADAEIKDAPNAIGLPLQARTLTLDRVEFRYADGPNVLDGISVEVKPGELVAFVGSSGAGKSTLLNLLPRFYDPTKGAIRLDSIDVRGVKLPDLRKHIAIVLQDNILLPTTVAENIAYGRPEATALEIQHAAQLAGAHDFISAMPNGYDTVVTEGGQNVSGGQRQRIAIARALLTHAPIIILDEPTSALDPHHEQLLTEQLQTLKRHRTIVIVSHRVHTLTGCDQILVLDAGQIVERGTHDELVEQQGRYADMAGALFTVDQAGELVAA